MRTARWLGVEFDRQHVDRTPSPKEHSGSTFVYAAGGLLILFGAFAAIASVSSTRVISRMIGPPRGNRLWDNPSGHDPLGPYHR